MLVNWLVTAGVDCKVNPAKLVGHIKTTFDPERSIVSCGCGNERLNIVPYPELPPLVDVPYRVLPDKINLASGEIPSLLVTEKRDVAAKLCRVVKSVPLVLTLKTVPFPELPPYIAVPNRVLPDKINPASGLAPSLLV